MVRSREQNPPLPWTGVMGVNKPSTLIVYCETLWLYKFVLQAKLTTIGVKGDLAAKG